MKNQEKIFELDGFISNNPALTKEFKELKEIFERLEKLRIQLESIRAEKYTLFGANGKEMGIDGTEMNKKLDVNSKEYKRLYDLNNEYKKASVMKARNVLAFIEKLVEIKKRFKLQEGSVYVEYGTDKKYSKYRFVAVFFNKKRIFCYHIADFLFKFKTPNFGNYLWDYLNKVSFAKYMV